MDQTVLHLLNQKVAHRPNRQIEKGNAPSQSSRIAGRFVVSELEAMQFEGRNAIAQSRASKTSND